MTKKKVKTRKIILASSSPRRLRLLKLSGLKFKVIKSDVNEDLLVKKFKNKGFKNLVKILSLAKALSVGTCLGMSLQGDEIVLGFDTIVVCKNKIISKPKNKKDALKKLLFLSNKRHKVFTGICLVDLKNKKINVDCEETSVIMKKISKKEAMNYINTKEPLDKAGAYAMQGIGRKFVRRITGDYFNVIGLPLHKFFLMLAVSTQVALAVTLLLRATFP